MGERVASTRSSLQGRPGAFRETIERFHRYLTASLGYDQLGLPPFSGHASHCHGILLKH